MLTVTFAHQMSDQCMGGPDCPWGHLPKFGTALLWSGLILTAIVAPLTIEIG